MGGTLDGAREPLMNAAYILLSLTSSINLGQLNEKNERQKIKRFLLVVYRFGIADCDASDA
jgi:hypothetical protein